MNKQIILKEIPNLTILDRKYIAQGFKHFGIRKNKVTCENKVSFYRTNYKCLTCSVNDIQIFIDIYDKKIKDNWKHPYLATRDRWISIYNILKEYRKEL